MTARPKPKPAAPQWTPGPWFVDKPLRRGTEAAIAHFTAPSRDGDPSLLIAHVEDVNGFEGDSQANARLIAVAPELHKELDAIAAALEDGETVTLEPGSVKAERIRAVLAKVEGR